MRQNMFMCGNELKVFAFLNIFFFFHNVFKHFFIVKPQYGEAKG